MNGADRSLLLEVLSGSLRGERLEVEPGGRVLIGRNADAGLRFDPDVDLDVSGRHAELSHTSGGWVIQDLGSTNGTWVNGVEVRSSRTLEDGDEIRLGREGPRVRIRLAAVASGVPSPSGVRPASAGPPRQAASSSTSDGPRALAWIRSPWAAAAVVTVALVTVFTLTQRKSRSAWTTERDRLTERIDSLLAAQGTQGVVMQEALAAAEDSVASARAEIQRLREQIRSSATRPDPAEVEELQRRLQQATVLLERQQIAASLDFDRIRRTVEPAVAMIWREGVDGVVTTGTAVAIDADGTLLTSRHVVGPGAASQGRLAVQFAGSAQVWRADVLETHPEVDLAWARADGILGSVPYLTAFNARADTFPVGSPVAIVGFPLGGRPGPTGNGTRRRAIVSGGVLLGEDGDGLRIQGYGAEGASGSPVVDADGRLLGLVYGAVEESGARVLLAVPIRFAEPAPPGS